MLLNGYPRTNPSPLFNGGPLLVSSLTFGPALNPLQYPILPSLVLGSTQGAILKAKEEANAASIHPIDKTPDLG